MENRSWIPFKELWNVTHEFALNYSSASCHKLKMLLRRHKSEFTSLLKNMPPSTEHRDKVKNAATVGLPVQSEPGTMQILEQSLIDEAIIISDLFQLNELASVDLLQAGQQQVPNYPNYSRGLVAVLLYWDGRRNLVNVLKTLIQCRKGKTWTLELPDEALEFATMYTDKLFQSGMAKKILNLLNEIQVENEMEKLNKQRGLGCAKHRKQVRDLIVDIRRSLAECLFYFAGQSGLPASDVVNIIQHLQKCKPDSELGGKLSPATVSLIFAVFFSFKLPCDAQNESDEKSINFLLNHPMISDAKFIPTIHKVLMGSSSLWKEPGIQGCLKFAWSMCLRSISQIPTALFSGTNLLQPNPDIIEQDEVTLDQSLAAQPFQFIKENIVMMPGFHTEEFFVRRLHGLLTDLIVNMPLKVKDMRNVGDEVARILMLYLMKGEESPPELRKKDFEQLMQLVASLYDQDPLDLHLNIEYWYSNENTFPQAGGTFITSPNKLHQKITQRQMALYKFIRQSGDLLPPLLYIPYLQMLSALSTGSGSARVAFEMLKSNGLNINGSGESSTVSWDHFFMSCHRYYTTLKQDKPTHYVNTSFSTFQQNYPPQEKTSQARAITPQEIEGLRAVMQLTAKIMQYDEIACITIYENTQWSACAVMFGLLQCPIPVLLKGDILKVLAQMSRLPDLAVGVVQALENTQLLNLKSVHGSDSMKSVDLRNELEEIEAKDEHFPLTTGFLKFLCKLVDSGVKFSGQSIADGFQNERFNPYLNFAVESVYLKSMTRAYGKAEEKWQVATCCLKLFNSLLLHYNPHPDHFLNPGKIAQTKININGQHTGFVGDNPFETSFQTPDNKLSYEPGFSLLLYLYNEGNFFKTVMKTIIECVTYLDKYLATQPMEEALVEATANSLQLIYYALKLQEPFLISMRESGKPLLITTVDKLLLSASSKSGKAECLVHIAKLITHHLQYPHICLLACDIISWLCLSSVATQRDVVMTMVNSCNLSTRMRILHGFVEVLDTYCPESEEGSSMNLSLCRLALLRLLVHCINLPSPNLSQFLLGFDITKPTIQLSLQDPGVLGTPRSCLHSVLTILSLKDNDDLPYVYNNTPKLRELCYQLLYRLSANPDTSGPILRYLRSSYDFVYNHLQCLPLPVADCSDEIRGSMLLQQAWLLKMTAIELFSLASRQQRTNVQRIFKLLFELQAETANLPSFPNSSLFGQSHQNPNLAGSFLGDPSMSNATFQSQSIVSNSLQLESVTKSMKILKILDVLELSQEFPSPLSLDQFVVGVVEQAIKSCEATNDNGVEYCDIKALHQLLKASLNTLLTSDEIGRREIAKKDVEKILSTVVDRNVTRETIHAKLSFLSAWRQTLEVALTVISSDVYPDSNRQQIMYEIANHIISKVRQNDAVQELTSPVASIILTLVMQIRSCFIKQNPSHVIGDMLNQMELSELLKFESEIEVDLNDISPLQSVVRGIVEWLLQSGVTEKVRAHLYTAFLYYMQLCQRPKVSNPGQRQSRPSFASFDDVYEKINQENFNIIKDYGNSFTNLICKDACNGQSVCRVLALACLDAITNVDSQNIWLESMIKNGSLTHISHSILMEDSCLQQYLNPTSEPLRVVYTYEQKMALLCTLAQSPGGARAVIDSDITVKLSECSFFDMRPSSKDEESSELSAVVRRYRQLLHPALQLCAALLSTLGGSNHSEATALVLQFMLSHADAIINIPLNISSTPINLQALSELNLLTSLLSQTATQDYSNTSLFGSVPQAVLSEIQGHIMRIQRQLLLILPLFFVFDRTNLKTRLESYQQTNDLSLVTSRLHEIGGNILSYCCTVALQGSDPSDSPVLLFAPELSDTLNFYNREEHRREPTLGILLRIMTSVLSQFQLLSEEKQQHSWKLENVDSLNVQELNEIVKFDDHHLSLNQEQKLAASILRKSIKVKESHLERLYFILESCILLLWQHLNYYILHAERAEMTNTDILFCHKKEEKSLSKSLRRLQDVSSFSGDSIYGAGYVAASPGRGGRFGVKQTDIEKLKFEVVQNLSDSLLQKLAKVEIETKVSSAFFIQPLVRRLQHIKKLHARD